MNEHMNNTNWTPERIKALRKAMGETQKEFAVHFRVGCGTVRCWEYNQYPPSGPATVLLDQLEEKVMESCQAS